MKTKVKLLLLLVKVNIMVRKKIKILNKFCLEEICSCCIKRIWKPILILIVARFYIIKIIQTLILFFQNKRSGIGWKNSHENHFGKIKGNWKDRKGNWESKMKLRINGGK